MKRLLLFIVFLHLVIIESDAQAQLYGLTIGGGDNNLGTIFHYDISSGSHTLDQSFNGMNGNNPNGPLTLFNGRFYGCTLEEGNGGLHSGVLFEWDPVTNIYTKKIDLDITTGSYPVGKLVQRGNKLYGATQFGAANDYGAFFEWDPITNIFSKKFDFSKGPWGSGYHSLTLYNDKFYGTSQVESNSGNIFEWDPTTNIYSIKKTFTDDEGGEPSYGLVLKGDKFYGTSFGGGVNYDGVIFEWDPATNVYIKKIDFDGINGRAPQGSLTLYAGKFYGMTEWGGANDAGVIFEWDPATNNYTKKFDFGSGIGDNTFGSLTLIGDKFYGTTSGYGYGTNNKGVIFEWNPNTNIYLKLFDFTGANGSYPWGGLVELKNTTLAIKLQSFTAQQHLHTSLLNWQTINEINTSHFIVQRSANGTTFTNIGSVDSRNTPGAHDYSLTDARPVDGVNFYRLQMVDNDGKTTYSSIIKIVFADKNELQVFPNPAKNIITLSGLQSKGTIKIIAADGKMVKQMPVIGRSLLLNISTLANGLYIIEYKNEKEIQQIKIVKK